MWDSSGSMPAMQDDDRQQPLQKLEGDLSGAGALMKSFTDAMKNVDKQNGFIVLSGSPGTGKTKMLKDFMKILDEQKIEKFEKFDKNIKDVDFISTMNKSLDHTPIKMDPALLQWIKAIIIPPIGDEALEKIANGEIDKSGIAGEHLDVTRETVQEGIRGGQQSARGVMTWVRQLIADPQHADLEDTRRKRAERAARDMEERRLAASRTQASAIAIVLSTGATAPIRPLRPVGFRK